MKQRRLWEHLTRETELEEETLPGQPILELAGDRKLIVEGHRGVREYGTQRITVAVGYGQIRISGCGLELSCMSRDCLVIRGRIDTISVVRRNSP